MDIDPEEFRRHYASLSEEGLLAIDRADLVEVARAAYDEECMSRNLQMAQQQEAQAEQTSSPSSSGGELQVAAIFLNFEEANLARGLLQSAGVACALENEFANSWAGSGSLRLMVHAEDYEHACEILENEISEEDLLAQAEAGADDAEQGGSNSET